MRKHPSRLGIQLKYPVYKKLCTLIVLSAVAPLAVHDVKNGKSCDGNEEERAIGAWRKNGVEDSVNAASTP